MSRKGTATPKPGEIILSIIVLSCCWCCIPQLRYQQRRRAPVRSVEFEIDGNTDDPRKVVRSVYMLPGIKHSKVLSGLVSVSKQSHLESCKPTREHRYWFSVTTRSPGPILDFLVEGAPPVVSILLIWSRKGSFRLYKEVHKCYMISSGSPLYRTFIAMPRLKRLMPIWLDVRKRS